MEMSIYRNAFIILLTIVSLIFGGSFFIISIAGILMVLETYKLTLGKKKYPLMLLECALMAGFVYLSGNFFGCIIFALIVDLPVVYRLLLCEVVTIILCMIYSGGNNSFSSLNKGSLLSKSFESNQTSNIAMILVFMIINTLLFLLVYGIDSLIKKTYENVEFEQKRIVDANINYIHERQINEKLLRQNAIIEKNARLLERENISRNIHNSVGHSITAAVMTLEAADMLYDVKPDEAREKMLDAKGRIKDSLSSIRRAVRVMDDESKDLEVSDLKAEFKDIIDEFVMDTSIKVNSDFTECDDKIIIDKEMAIFLSGVLKELLTNGCKHGKADVFAIYLSGDNAHIKLDVSDNGKSDTNNDNLLERIENGYGIKKIISYVESHGGKTKFSVSNGFRVQIELNIVNIKEKEDV